MIDTNIILKSKVYSYDSIGNQIAEETNVSVPIIRIEDVYAKEFYAGAQSGFKPNLRVIISSLNYNDENELTYMNRSYQIIRTSSVNIDELALICQDKINEN